jgi:RNase P subunit RPR2
MADHRTSIDQDYHRMVCPYCRIETDVEIARYRTASPQHIDLECTCQNCGEKWQAAGSAENAD